MSNTEKHIETTSEQTGPANNLPTKPFTEIGSVDDKPQAPELNKIIADFGEACYERHNRKATQLEADLKTTIKALITTEVEAFAERLIASRKYDHEEDMWVIGKSQIDTELARYRKGEL